MENLNLMDEDEAVTLNMPGNSAPDMNIQLSLIGSFASDKPVCSHIMKERLTSVWRPGRGVTIKELNEGRFLFQFNHKLDLERIIKGGPWFFDNYMLLLERIKPRVPLMNIPLQHIDMWVQAFNLPVGFMTEMIGKHLGNYIGEFLEYDDNNNTGFWRMYMRIKVWIDVTKPLKKERKVRLAGGGWNVVQFKYERLGVFCYLCGIISHIERFCNQIFEMEEDNGERNWGEGGSRGETRTEKPNNLGGNSATNLQPNNDNISGLGDGNNLGISVIQNQGPANISPLTSRDTLIVVNTHFL